MGPSDSKFSGNSALLWQKLLNQNDFATRLPAPDFRQSQTLALQLNMGANVSSFRSVLF